MNRLSYLPPAEHVYESYAPSRYYGYPLSKYFAARFSYLREDEWISRILAGAITVNGGKADPDYVLKERDRIVTSMGLRAEPPADRSLKILYENARIRAFNKSAPIPVHPSGRYFKNSMTELLKEVYPDEVPRPVQRLDATTTGALVFAKTRETAAFLTNEFSKNRVGKEYLALVEGSPKEKKFVVDAPIGKIKGSARGIGENVIDPKPATTEIEWLSEIGGRSLLKATPRSGRTNQIRVHLASVGLPVINDPVYGQRASPRLEGMPPHVFAGAGESSQTRSQHCSLAIRAEPAGSGGALAASGLHAYRLSFQCFETFIEIAAPWPPYFQPFIDAWKQRHVSR